MARAKPLEIPRGYEVLRDGTIVSHLGAAPHELAQRMDNSSNGIGYPSVRMYRDVKVDGIVIRKQVRIAVHRLVAAAYLPPRPSLAHYICHKDGNKMNTHADNLRWDSPSGNNFDTWRHRRERERPLAAVDDLF